MKKNLATKFDMKYLSMMHYLLGLEVWQSPDELFLSQGKYVVKILNRFGMMDYKAMDTPMELNLKFLCDNTSQIVDATIYRQMIGFLMQILNMRPNICFVVNTLNQYMVDMRWVSLQGYVD